MMDRKRWRELKQMSESQRRGIGEKLGLSGANASSVAIILAMETRRDNPEISRNIRDWIR